MSDNQTLIWEFESEQPYDWITDFLAGAVLIVVPLVTVLPYGLILKLFVKEEEFEGLPAFRIMTHLGLCDMVMMAGSVFTGLALVSDYDFPRLMTIIMGALLNWVWQSYQLLVTLLAINRLLTSLKKHKILLTLFSPKSTNILCFVCYVPGVIFGLVLTFVIGSPSTFYRSYYSWIPEFKANQTHAEYLESLELTSLADMVITLLTMAITILCYIVLFVFIKIQSQSTVSAEGHQAETKRENVIAIQAFFISAFASANTILWYLPIYYNGLYNYLSLIVWFANGAVNPFIYLSINKTIKNKLTKAMPNWLVKIFSKNTVQHIG